MKNHTHIDSTQPQNNRVERPYEAPTLTTIGRAADVIRGVAGSGDDLMGYSFPEFEFEPDNERAVAPAPRNANVI